MSTISYMAADGWGGQWLIGLLVICIIVTIKFIYDEPKVFGAFMLIMGGFFGIPFILGWLVTYIFGVNK